MIHPPEGHDELPHKVSKHYYMMMAEIMGHSFEHDDYCCIASWMLVYIIVSNEKAEQEKNMWREKLKSVGVDVEW